MPHVRAASEDDLAGVLAIYNDVIATSTAVYTSEPATLTERDAWFAARRSQGFPVLVAVDGGEVLGFASFGEWRGAWPGYRYTVEHSVHVRGDVRGRGIGRAGRGAISRRAGAGKTRDDRRHRCGQRRFDPLSRAARVRARRLLPRGRPQVRPLARSDIHAAVPGSARRRARVIRGCRTTSCAYRSRGGTLRATGR